MVGARHSKIVHQSFNRLLQAALLVSTAEWANSVIIRSAFGYVVRIHSALGQALGQAEVLMVLEVTFMRMDLEVVPANRLDNVGFYLDGPARRVTTLLFLTEQNVISWGVSRVTNGPRVAKAHAARGIALLTDMYSPIGLFPPKNTIDFLVEGFTWLACVSLRPTVCGCT